MVKSLFPGMIIKEARSFRVTRNEDIDVEEDDAALSAHVHYRKDVWIYI